MARKSSLYSLLFTIFNDSIGWGIVLTIFAPLIFDPSQGILPASTSDGVRNILLGLLIGSYAVTQFISMPLIGALSDHFGRKRILEWTLFGAMGSFILSALAVSISSLSLLFISRLLAGLFSGNSGTAQASIADMSTDQTKAKNLSLAGVVGGISWIVGPPLGGLLSTSSWVEWFDFSTPFLFLSVLFLINLIWLNRSYVETYKREEKHDWKQEIKDLRKLSKIPQMTKWLSITFFFYLGWFFFVLFYPTFLVQKFAFTQEGIGYFSGYLSIFWLVGSLLLNRGWAEKFNPKTFILAALPVLAALILATTFLTKASWWLFTFPLMGLITTSCWIYTMTLASNLAGKANQGKVFGVTLSLSSLALFISPLCAGFLAPFSIELPMLVGAFILFATSAVALVYKGKKEN